MNFVHNCSLNDEKDYSKCYKDAKIFWFFYEKYIKIDRVDKS